MIQTAQFVTTMLRDISATKLQAIRNIFEANQVYFTELHELMRTVKSYVQKHDIALPETKKKSVFLALTSNRRFYGSLNRDVMQEWLAAYRKSHEADGMVIGQTGQQYMKLHGGAASARLTFVSFNKDVPTTKEVVAVLEKISEYTEVILWHPTFINSFRQEVCFTDITHEPKQVLDTRKGAVLPDPDFIIEPELPELLAFFRSQIRLVLMQRVLLETQVALTGARLMKMQHARERAGELAKAQRLTIHKETSRVHSMRLLETFTGFRTDRTI